MLVHADVGRRVRAMLALALLIAIAGGVVLATAAGARRTDTAYARLLEASAGADVEVAVSGPNSVQNFGRNSGFYTDLAHVLQVASLAPVVGVDVLVTDRHDAPVLLRSGVDARMGRDVERPKIVEGRMFDPTADDEVLADRTVAQQLDLHVGSELVVQPGEPGAPSSAVGPLRVRVVGLAVIRDNVIPINALASTPVLFGSPAVLARIPVAAHTFEAVFVRLDPGTTIPAFRQRARAVVDEHPESGGQLFVVDERTQTAKVDRGIRPQAVALLLFSGLVALTSLLILRQLLVREVFVASGDHATLRAVGLGRRQRCAVGMARPVLVVVLGAVGAVVVAVLLSPLMPIGPARIAEPHPGLAVNVAVLGLGALAMVAVLTVLIAPSAWRLSRGDEALDDRQAHPSQVVGALGRSGAPVTAVVGTRLALEPGRGRTAVPTRTTLVGAIVATTAVVGALTFGANLTHTVATPRLYGQRWQVEADLEFSYFPRAQVAPFLSGRDGVTGWTFGDHDDFTVAGRHVPAIVLTKGRGPVQFPTLLEGRAARNRGEVVVGTATLARIDRAIGDTVRVTSVSERAPRRVRIVGRAVFPYFGQGEVTPTGLGEGIALLGRSGGDPISNFFFVDSAPGARSTADVERLASALRASTLCQGVCTVSTEQRPADVRNYARIEATPLILAGLLALLATATVGYLLVTSISRRRRDLAILKTLGFTRHQVSTAVAWQATVVGAVALLVGIPAGVLAGTGAWRFFADHLGVATEVRLPVVALVLAVPVVLLATNAMAIGPALAARRLRPGRVLRAE